MDKTCIACAGKMEAGWIRARNKSDPTGISQPFMVVEGFVFMRPGTPTSWNPIAAFMQGFRDEPGDTPMPLVPYRCTGCGRVELYANEDRGGKAWLGGVTTSNSRQYEAQLPATLAKLTCLLVLADFADWSPVTLADGRSEQFYTVSPLHTAERDFELKHGVVPLLKRLQGAGHTTVVDVKRASVV